MAVDYCVRPFCVLFLLASNVVFVTHCQKCNLVWPRENMEFLNPPRHELFALEMDITKENEFRDVGVCWEFQGSERICDTQPGSHLRIVLPASAEAAGSHVVKIWCGVNDPSPPYELEFNVAKFPSADPTGMRSRYLDVLSMSLLGMYEWDYGVKRKELAFPFSTRVLGKDWPVTGLTMVGQLRLDNIRYALETVVEEGVVGDFLEAGVWRGGAGIYAKAVLESLGVPSTERRIIMCDSYQGLPLASTDEDKDLWAAMNSDLGVSAEEVARGFLRYQLLDHEGVFFHKGFFQDSLPSLPSELKFSVIRLDGDMYESYMDCLFNLYDKLQLGGFVIMDEYSFDQVSRAVAEFRGMHGIQEPIVFVDLDCAYWRKTVPLKSEWYTQFNAKRRVREDRSSSSEGGEKEADIECALSAGGRCDGGGGGGEGAGVISTSRH